jgi:D-alanine-D-alanine ligase
VKPEKIAVLQGGQSNEAEVSRSSAGEVSAALAKTFATVTAMELDDSLTGMLTNAAPDVVFPVLHGPPGEDGTVQGYLEILGLPYVGSDVHASAVAMDKSVAKALFRRAGLPVVDDVVLAAGSDPAAAAVTVSNTIGERIVVKPLSQGSAIGVTPLANGGDPTDALKTALDLGGGVLVEPYVLGREVTVGVLDTHGDPPVTLPPIEIATPAGTWYDYQHRYTAGESDHLIPARLPEATLEELKRVALTAHQCLDCRDLSRADFIVTDADEIVLLEVNTMPGMTPTSLYPDGCAAVGISFVELVARLVRSAWGRG